jgi:hypothetical protein
MRAADWKLKVAAKFLCKLYHGIGYYRHQSYPRVQCVYTYNLYALVHCDEKRLPDAILAVESVEWEPGRRFLVFPNW